MAAVGIGLARFIERVADALNDRARGLAARQRGRNALVVSEIALALVLLIVSGLMIRTFIALRRVDPGFVRPKEVQTFRVSLSGALIKDPLDHRTFLRARWRAMSSARSG